eukprot:887262-Prymnesium_polylepis.1
MMVPVLSLLTVGLNNGVGRKPPMALNSWCALGCSASMLNASSIKIAADLLVSTGLAARGYEYVNLDDCYIAPGAAGRNATTGRLVPDLKLFGGEDGIRSLSAYVHSKKLKFGL